MAPDYDNIKVSREDFLHALDEVHPAFGVSEQELQQCVLNGIIKFDHHIEVRCLNVQNLRHSAYSRTVPCLLIRFEILKELPWSLFFSMVIYEYQKTHSSRTIQFWQNSLGSHDCHVQ